MEDHFRYLGPSAVTEEEKNNQLAEQLAKLGRTVNELAARLQRLEAGGPPDVQANRQSRFAENSEWARHYSTVRMTTTTFLVGVSLGILSFRWPAAGRPPISFIALSGVVWIVAVLLFLVFTRLTYQEMERARRKRNLLPDGMSAPREKSYRAAGDAASWIVGLITIFYGALLFYLANIWLWHFVVPTAANFVRTIGCAVPGAVVFVGLLALCVTLLQRGADQA